MVKLLGRSLGLIAALLLYGFTGTTEAQVLVLYDDFPGPRISPAKWFGREAADGADAPNLETQRQIRSGQLQMGLTTYGSTATDEERAFGRQRVRMTEPSGVTTIEAKVIAKGAFVEGCPANPDPTLASVEIVATFFNDGTVGGPGRTGDIAARFRKVRSSVGGNRIEASLHRCNDVGCFQPGGLLGTHVFTTSWTNGAVHTFRIEWDEPSDLFRFTVNPGGAGEEIATIPYAFSDSTPLIGEDFKELRIETAVANCAAGQKRATIIGRYDDVMTNP